MVNSHDVAREAGVSQSTVSRALRDSHRISAETKARVRATAERLGYVASQRGHQLATGRTRRVGVLATELANPFYLSLLDPLHDALRAHGYRMALLTDPPQSPVAFDELVDGSLDGVVLTNCRLRSDLPRAVAARGVSVVTLNREVEPAAVDSCAVDNVKGAMSVAEAILAAGHTRIAHIAGPANTSTGRDRAAGFRRALAGAGIRVDRAFVRHGEFTFEAGHEAMVSLFRHPDPPTAVFCGNDVIAVGACNAVSGLGLRIPEDVSVVGFDDISVASWEILGLTTVRCDLSGMATRAAELLVSRIEDPKQPRRRVVLDPELVIRKSLGRRGS
ncbi:LacI family DNA-binding transcriptional regulator [Streptomyces sp. SID8352]|uniref:LacI family DNA-binding transcriptional regulator n=1 Tax=Streptomyces sp. SID8352 TaxID=2690338 RepID=UPI00136CF739|nr:LacI family DNA-binding transcriptional regulator [Streptomyces sp. SID8352]MYU26084.1 substrate-binding domain-containing protein [Streptomyces sp. SID8352]